VLGAWCLGLYLDLDRKFFSESWQVEEEKNMAGGYPSTTMSG
jgi:hypothetical protein